MRLLAIACVMLFATTARAQSSTGAHGSSSSPAPGSSKTAPAKGAKPPPPKPLTKSEQQIMDVQTAKARFMAAMGACTRPESCDPTSPARNQELTTMVQQANDAFMEACVQCATDKACEGERDKILQGKGRYGFNVCVGSKASSGSKSGKPSAAPPSKPSASTSPGTSK